MTKRDKIQCLVTLYRALERPQLVEEGLWLIADIPTTSLEIIELVLKAKQAYPDKVTKFSLDGVEQDESSDSKILVNTHLKLAISLPSKSFYSDVSVFIESSSQLSMGQLSDDFYLVNEDYFSGEEDTPKSIKQLKKLCAWTLFLQSVLPHTETKTNWLTFILFPESINGNGRSKRAFHSKVQPSDIKLDLSKTTEFLEIAVKDDLHSSERKSVFRQALAEILEHQKDDGTAFSYILENMDRLYQTYHDNYERYINGFSIEKLKKEVIEDYNKFSIQINSSLNDIITKAFAIPASLAALALLIRLENFASHMMMVLVVIVTTIISILMLSWQSKSIRLIKKHISTTFGKFSNSDTAGSEFAQTKQTELEESAKSVSIRLKVLGFISWLPIFSVGVYLWFQYPIIQTKVCSWTIFLLSLI